MSKNEFKEAHRFSSHHRKDLEESNVCGCFFCLQIFKPSEITDWCDNGNTAICPHCGIDSIIGDKSGYPITKEFLQGMRKEWFW